MAAGDHCSEDEDANQNKLTRYVTIACIIAAMGGGLMFGYEIGVSGAVTSTSSFLKTFDNPTINPIILQIAFLSFFYVSAIVSSTDFSDMTKKGRKGTLLIGSVLFLVGTLISGFAREGGLLLLTTGRGIAGMGIGLVIHSAPLYVSEMAPCKYRGALNIGFQLFITIGILMANVLNYLFAQMSGGWPWHLSLGGAMVPSLIIIVGSRFLPKTPNSMIQCTNNQNEAREILIKIRGVQNVDEEFNDLIAAGEASRRVSNEWRDVFRRKYRPHLTMAIAIPIFQQFTGINVIIMFYLPLLFRTIGLGNNASLISVVVTGIVSVVANIISIYGADKWGRRKLFFGGGIQMLISQIVIAVCISLKPCVTANSCNLPKWYAIMVVLFICVYVSGFASSWGPLGWLVPSEIFPLEIRCCAQSISVSLNLFFTYVTTIVLLNIHWHLKFWWFIIFGFFVVVMSLFINFFLPETKNIPIEEMSIVWKQHWYWSRFVVEHSDYQDEDVEVSLGALTVEQV